MTIVLKVLLALFVCLPAFLVLNAAQIVTLSQATHDEIRAWNWIFWVAYLSLGSTTAILERRLYK